MPAVQKFTSNLPLSDSAPTLGMNTVDDPRRLPDGECVQLTNAFPGAPPIPRNGCPGDYVTFIDQYDFWIAPFAFFQYTISTVPHYYVVGWIYNSNYLNCSTEYRYAHLVSYEIGQAFYEFGAALVLPSPNTSNAVKLPLFSVLNIYSNAYCFISRNLYAWTPAGGSSDTASTLSHKVIESPSIIREMCIATAGKVHSVFEGGDGSLLIDQCVGYGFQFVRRTDAAAFGVGANPLNVILPPGITGEPQRIDTFLPGSCIGVTSPANILTHQITNATAHMAVTLQTGGGTIEPDVLTAVKQGATHVRVCRSLVQSTEAQAANATKYWCFDIGLNQTGSYADYEDAVTDADLTLETNQLVVGYSVAPAAAYSKFFKGRLFIMALTGKVYYSEVPGGDGMIELDMAEEYPQAWASLFKPLNYVIDCNSSDGRNASGIAILHDDIYFFKESGVWVVYGGDPTATPATLLNGGEIGCVFPLTIKPLTLNTLGDCIFFMSNLGPAFVTTGGVIRLASEFKIRELWPNLQPNYLFDQLSGLDSSGISTNDYAIRNCSATFFRNTIWVMYQTVDGVQKIFGYYIDPTDTNIQGAMEMQLAASDIFGTQTVLDEVSGAMYLLATTPDSLAVIEFLQQNTWEDMTEVITKTITLTTGSSILLSAATCLGGNTVKRGVLIATWTSATKSGSVLFQFAKSSVTSSPLGDTGIGLTGSSEVFTIANSSGETATINLKFLGDN